MRLENDARGQRPSIPPRLLPTRRLAATCAVIAAGWACGLGTCDNPAPRIPIESFWRHPAAADYRLAPSGGHHAFLAPANERRDLIVVGPDGRRTSVASASHGEIGTYLWIDDEMIVLEMSDSETRTTALYRTLLSGDGPELLTALTAGDVRILDPLQGVAGTIAVRVRGDAPGASWSAHRVDVHAHRITAPVLIAQGGRDPVVNRAESEQMVEALRARGIDVTYVLEEEEGHGSFRDEQAWISLWRAIDDLLEREIGAGAEPS